MSVLLILSAFLLQDDERRSYSAPGFTAIYLGRHQLHDGSWGERSGTCDCRREDPEPGPEVQRRASELLIQLGEDSLDSRVRAQDSLWALGPGIIPQIRESAGDGDLERRLRCRQLLAQRNRFSKPGDLESTALALLDCLWQGHTPHSRDVCRGVAIGPMMEKGLRWLIQVDPQPTRDPLGHVLATLALVEGYGKSKDDILGAVAKTWLRGIAPSTTDSTEVLAWKGVTFHAARRNRLMPDARDDLGRILALLDRRPERLARIGAYLSRVWLGETPDPGDARAMLCVHPLDLDPVDLFFGTLVFRHAFGREELIENWFGFEVRRALLVSQGTRQKSCDEGAWMKGTTRETVRRTALTAMSFQVYYLYVDSPSEWEAPEK